MKLAVFVLAIVACAFCATTLTAVEVTKTDGVIDWTTIMTDNTTEVNALVTAFKDTMTDEFKQFWGTDDEANAVSRTALFGESNLKELTAMATTLKVDLIDLAWYNFYLDRYAFTVQKLDGADTFASIPSIEVIFSYEETVAMGIDFTPVVKADELRDIAMTIVDGDVTAFIIPGMVGYLFAQKKSAFSAAFVNAAGYDVAPTASALFSVSVRNIADTYATYKELNDDLATLSTNMTAGCYVAVVGAAKDEGFVFASFGANDSNARTFSDDHWYLAQSLETITDEKYIDDNDFGITTNITAAADNYEHMSYDLLSQVMHTYPGRNVDNLVTITSQPGDNNLDVIINGCHTIYKDFAKTKVSSCQEDPEFFNIYVTLISICIITFIITIWVIGAKNVKRSNNYKIISE